MNQSFLFFILFTVGLSAIAQHKTISEEFNIQFESTEYLPSYTTESEDVIGYQNNNFAVDIQKIDVTKAPKGVLEDLKALSKKVALDFGFTDLGAGNTMPDQPNSNYIRGYDKEDGRKIPVYVGLIYVKEKNLVYQITVDCYNSDLREGTKITRSFKLLK
ncbi:hypothetical protein [Urechidicola vernalis]|uniref:Uncharacterized protein n=1 Tax=Urechidicola vernalis TaxID=3075600 RepID=A0ABU2Y3Q6_9FLAO|nr:hypothetical protein [Urechidicola sp. P050]MDT0552332.1 hypothetical protein [Urechidicola sp. P050]